MAVQQTSAGGGNGRVTSSAQNSADYVNKDLTRLRGEAAAILIRHMIQDAQRTEHMPDEARLEEPSAVKAFMGRAYGGLLSHDDLPGSSLLGTDKSDSTIEFTLHDMTRAHLLGLGLQPLVKATRSKTALAEALTELALYRWKIGHFNDTAGMVLMDSRLHGTGAAEVYSDPEIGLAKSNWVPIRDLILDPYSNGDLRRTRFRGVQKWVLRSEVRRLLRVWDKPAGWADQAGYQVDSEDPVQRRRMRAFTDDMQSEMESVKLTHFYWSDSSRRRHVILLDNIPEPVWDVDRWPYLMPPKRWPIIVFPWNIVPGKIWGSSDFAMAQIWHESLSWMLRFLLVSAAESVKVVPVFDPALGDATQLEAAFGNLREPYRPVQMKIKDIVLSGMKLDQLMAFLNVPTNLADLRDTLIESRELVGMVSGLDEMLAKAEDPNKEPPRLGHRIFRWKSYLSELLEAESFADLTTVPRQALVTLRADKPGPDGTTSVESTLAYMDLKEAESLERNQLPRSPLESGMTATEMDETPLPEKKLREKVPVVTSKGPRTLADGEQVEINGPGIARYVSRQSLADSWEGSMALPPDRALAELEFLVDIKPAAAVSDLAAQRAANALQILVQLYQQWGLMEYVYAWAGEMVQALDGNSPLPPTPRMAANLVALHNEFVRASGVEFPHELDLIPEDLARALSAAAGIAQQQQQGQAAMDAQAQNQDLERAKLALQAQIAEGKLAIEQIRQQNEQMRQQGETTRAQMMLLRDYYKFVEDQATLPQRLAQQQARSESGQARAVQSQAQAMKTAIDAEQAGAVAGLQAELTAARTAQAMAAAAQAHATARSLDVKSATQPSPNQVIEDELTAAKAVEAAEQANLARAKSELVMQQAANVPPVGPGPPPAKGK